MTYKDKLVFFQVGLNAVLNMMNGLLKIKRVLYLQKVYMKITILKNTHRKLTSTYKILHMIEVES